MSARGKNDIAAITLPDASDRIVLGRVSGAIEAVSEGPDGRFKSHARYGSSKTPIQALTTIGAETLVSAQTVDRAGSLSLHQLRSPWIEPKTIALPGKPWSLLASAQQRWLAVGYSGVDPLAVYDVGESGLATTEPRRLGRGDERGRKTAVYALATAALGSVLSPACVISGWYDSVRAMLCRHSSALPAACVRSSRTVVEHLIRTDSRRLSEYTTYALLIASTTTVQHRPR